MPAPEYRRCQECGDDFPRPRGRSHEQWARMRCCSPSCANALRARGGTKAQGALSRKAMGNTIYLREWQRRRDMPRWAAEWEDRRRAEDLRGGDHLYANLQCACYECNCFVKRDQPMNDQLRLVG